MRLTEKKVMQITIELWTWLAETGKRKEDWSGWEKYGQMENDCPLCEYDSRKSRKDCAVCPYYKRFGVCYTQGGLYPEWEDAKTPASRKRCASQFLEQLKQLLEE